MTRSKSPVAPISAVRCAAPDCAVEFVPARSTAKYHSATCRQRATRARRAAAESVEADDAERAAGGGSAEHGLVRATRRELEKAKAIDTVDGQIALQLARKLTDPDHVSPGLAKELRASLVAAKGGANAVPADDDATPNPEDDLPDEVKAARRKRDAAREAAGSA